MKNSKNTRLKILIGIFILLFIGLYVYIYIVPRVSDIFVDTYIAEYGTLEIGEESQFLIVRDERLHTSDESGQIDRVVSAGTLMRKNSRIVTVGSTAYYSQNRGIVSYHYDGLENVYTIDQMARINEKALNTKNEDGKEKNPVQQCTTSAKKGSPIFKIVDNKEWYIICWLDPGKTEGFDQGKIVSIRFSDGTELKVKVYQINPQGEKNQIIFSCNRYYEKFDRIRTGKCKLIKTSKSGIFIETDSIVEEDGRKGVYQISILGAHKFVPVKILAEDGDVTVVQSGMFQDEEYNQIETIKNYAEILRIDRVEETEGSDENAD